MKYVLLLFLYSCMFVACNAMDNRVLQIRMMINSDGSSLMYLPGEVREAIVCLVKQCYEKDANKEVINMLSDKSRAVYFNLSLPEQQLVRRLYDSAHVSENESSSHATMTAYDQYKSLPIGIRTDICKQSDACIHKPCIQGSVFMVPHEECKDILIAGLKGSLLLGTATTATAALTSYAMLGSDVTYATKSLLIPAVGIGAGFAIGGLSSYITKVTKRYEQKELLKKVSIRELCDTSNE